MCNYINVNTHSFQKNKNLHTICYTLWPSTVELTWGTNYWFWASQKINLNALPGCLIENVDKPKVKGEWSIKCAVRQPINVNPPVWSTIILINRTLTDTVWRQTPSIGFLSLFCAKYHYCITFNSSGKWTVKIRIDSCIIFVCHRKSLF